VPEDLPEFPEGWWAVALSRELRRGQVRRVTFGGQPQVLFRTESGRAALMDAYCPHLGAHLGHGGRVHGEAIECPFHAFRFDAGGRCVFVPGGHEPPPAARASIRPLLEVNGLLLGWDGPGDEPRWEIPPLESTGWGPLRSRRWVLRGHPQEVTENSVDLIHFSTVHGYERVEMLRPLAAEGPVLDSHYAITRPKAFAGRSVRVEIDVEARGLGYSTVLATVPSVGARARLFVLPRPLGRRRIELRVAMQLHRDVDPSAVHPVLRFVPRALYRAIVGEFTFRGFTSDVSQDFAIWKHKRFVRPPALAAGDGPIGPYRRWARQFYEANEPGLLSETTTSLRNYPGTGNLETN
jgi:nitrite reductase/ring-hydroxylating ferredoxin subunit